MAKSGSDVYFLHNINLLLLCNKDKKKQIRQHRSVTNSPKNVASIIWPLNANISCRLTSCIHLFLLTYSASIEITFNLTILHTRNVIYHCSEIEDYIHFFKNDIKISFQIFQQSHRTITLTNNEWRGVRAVLTIRSCTTRLSEITVLYR